MIGFDQSQNRATHHTSHIAQQKPRRGGGPTERLCARATQRRRQGLKLAVDGLDLPRHAKLDSCKTTKMWRVTYPKFGHVSIPDGLKKALCLLQAAVHVLEQLVPCLRPRPKITHVCRLALLEPYTTLA